MSAATPGLAVPAGPPSRVERYAPPLLGLIVLVGLLLRVREAIRTPLWFEEIYIAMVSHLPVPRLVDTIGHDIHPPLGYLLEHFWERLGGMSAPWLKALPITLTVLGLIACFFLARRMLGTTAALLGVALIALTRGHARFTTEVQPFALECLLVTLAVYAAWDWLETRRPWSAVAYVVCGGAALYTHYVSLAIVFTLCVWGAIALRGDRRALFQWLGLHVLLALIFLPQLPTQIRQFIQEDAAHHGHFPYASDWFALWRLMALGATYLIPVYVLLALLPLFDPAHRRAASLLWCLSVLPLFSLRLWSLNFPRETLWVLSLFVPLVAAGVGRLPGAALRGAVAALLVVLALKGDVARQVFAEPVMLMDAKQKIDRGAEPSDVVLDSDTHALLFLRFYDPAHRHVLLWRGDEGIPYFDGGLMVEPDWRITPEAFDSLAARDARWWAVSLNRAQVRPVHGHTRTGEYLDSLVSVVPGARVEPMKPVELWESPAVARTLRTP